MVPICFIIAFAIVAFGSSEATSPSYPRSPCPRIFKYDRNYIEALNGGSNSSASIMVRKPKKATFLQLELYLQVRGSQLKSLHKDEDLFKLNLVNGGDAHDPEISDMEFRLDMSPTEKMQIASPYLIKVNGKPVCKGKKFEGVSAAFTTMFIKVPITEEPIYPRLSDTDDYYE